VVPGAASTGEVAIDANAVYSLGSSSGESERLLRQAEELASESEALLDRVELGPGDSAIDLGCGPCGILELLHRRVFPGGRVVGLDSDPAHVEMAAEFVSKRDLDGVEVVAADARHTGLQQDSFDVVHARTLLINVPEPEIVLAEMVRLTRPGGWVASLEPDCEHSIYYPHRAVFDRLHELFMVAFSRNGADPLIGRRLGELYRQAGLEDVGVDVRAAVYAVGADAISVNGHPIPIAGAPSQAAARPRVEHIPNGHVFLLGDNTPLSIDSRTFGPVPDTDVVGRVLFTAASPVTLSLLLLAIATTVLGSGAAVARRRRARPAIPR
jgi:ubiquinone/menaquinone biosynthesis C-methylase UbiE